MPLEPTPMTRLGTARHDVLVVIPTYDEIANIDAISRAVLDLGYRLLIVDDHSPDGTGRRATALADGDAMNVLHRTTKAGLGPAYGAGFAWGMAHGAEILCEMDADFSHDPNDLERLVAAVDAGADIAIGSRYVPGGGVVDWPWHRRALSRGGNLYAGTMLGSPVRDLTSGLRAFRRGVLERLQPDACRASGYAFQIEMAWRAHLAGCEVVEIPITFRDRTRGESKMNIAIAREAVGLITRWGLGRMVGRLPWRPE